ncbi:MAG: methionine--tRNA ligase [Archaeoglobaceae archaeon]
MKLVTCGLPYANGKAHIGHLRTYVPADVYVRYLRMMGEEVVFVCGSDCHGTPIVVNAEREGVTPKQLVDRYHEHFQRVFKALDIEFDFYGRTDADYHHRRTQEIVKAMIDNGYVYPKEIELAYCPKCERFLPDRYVEGVCPYCGATARGDECDQGCGRHLEPGEILQPRCKICGTPAVFRKQKHYFFKLTDFKDFLEDFLEKLRGTENALNYAKQFVKNLRDWCITRNLEWGVKFPGEENLVVYVWVDAPIGYISFTEKACENSCDWEAIWKRGEAEIVHFIGLDIVYHHCIFWPAMLKAAGYSLPTAVVASGMVKVEGKTFSKSRGYVVWVEDDYLAAGFEPDYLRYYIVSYTSHQKDLNFSWEVFREKVNNELIATLGNFLYRVMHFAWRNFGEVRMEVDEEILKRIRETRERIETALSKWEFKDVCDAFMELAGFGNVYFQNAKPWDAIKVDRKRAEKAVANCLQLAKALVIFAYPVMPRSMQRVAKVLGLDLSSCTLDDAERVDEVVRVSKPEVPFRKVEDSKIEELQKVMKRRFGGMEEISIEDFQKLDIRVGRVVSAERIPKSRKLLRLEVDVGGEIRQIVAGIAETYEPEELKGKLVVVLTNIKPAKLMGVESRGMLLAADVDGKAVLLVPEKEVEPGTKIR